MARAFGSYPECRRFESNYRYQNKSTCESKCFCFGNEAHLRCMKNEAGLRPMKRAFGAWKKQKEPIFSTDRKYRLYLISCSNCLNCFVLKNSSSEIPKPSQSILIVTIPGFLLFPYRTFFMDDGLPPIQVTTYKWSFVFLRRVARCDS